MHVFCFCFVSCRPVSQAECEGALQLYCYLLHMLLFAAHKEQMQSEAAATGGGRGGSGGGGGSGSQSRIAQSHGDGFLPKRLKKAFHNLIKSNSLPVISRGPCFFFSSSVFFVFYLACTSTLTHCWCGSKCAGLSRFGKLLLLLLRDLVASCQRRFVCVFGFQADLSHLLNCLPLIPQVRCNIVLLVPVMLAPKLCIAIVFPLAVRA